MVLLVISKTTNKSFITMQKVTKNVDALGFDKWQIADVRRAYASNKPTYTKLNKIAEKIAALGKDYEELLAQLEAWEGPVKIITQKVLGMDLTSQEVLAFHANPALFAEKYPEHPLSAELKTPVDETPEETHEVTPVEAQPAAEETPDF